MQQLPETDARNFYSCDSNFLLVKKSVGERNFLIPVYCYTVPLCAIIHFEDMKIRIYTRSGKYEKIIFLYSALFFSVGRSNKRNNNNVLKDTFFYYVIGARTDVF